MQSPTLVCLVMLEQTRKNSFNPSQILVVFWQCHSWVLTSRDVVKTMLCLVHRDRHTVQQTWKRLGIKGPKSASIIFGNLQEYIQKVRNQTNLDAIVLVSSAANPIFPKAKKPPIFQQGCFVVYEEWTQKYGKVFGWVRSHVVYFHCQLMNLEQALVLSLNLLYIFRQLLRGWNSCTCHCGSRYGSRDHDKAIRQIFGAKGKYNQHSDHSRCPVHVWKQTSVSTDVKILRFIPELAVRGNVCIETWIFINRENLGVSNDSKLSNSSVLQDTMYIPTLTCVPELGTLILWKMFLFWNEKSHSPPYKF